MSFKLIFLLLCSISGLFIRDVSASCHWREADLCLATLAVYGNVYGIIPKTDAEMTVFCRYMKESHNCVRDFFKQCMSEDIFDTGFVLVQSTFEFYDKFCTKGTETQKEWLKNAPCMSENFNKTKSCSDYALAGIERLEKIDFDYRFPTLCCAFNNIMQCQTDELGKHCEGDFEKMVNIMMKNILSDIPIVACKIFKPKSKQCVDLLPPPGTKSKGRESDSQLVQLLAEFLSI